MHLVCPVLVGRERELERAVAALLRAAAGGAGTVVVVAGETGVGKTRLVSAVRELAERDGVAMAGGGCLEPFATQPYAPVAELLRDLLRGRDAVGRPCAARRASSRGCFACCRSWAGPAEDGAAVEEHERYRVARGVCSLLERCAAEQPLVVVLEDLHWSDAATLELLPWLARRVRDCAVLVLATLRSDELARAPRPAGDGRRARAPAPGRADRARAAGAGRGRGDGAGDRGRCLAGAAGRGPPAQRRQPAVRGGAGANPRRRVRRGAADDPGGDPAPRRPPPRRRAGAAERRLGGRRAVRARAGAADRRARRRGGVGRGAGGAGAGAGARGAPRRLPVPSRADARRGVRPAARARAPRVARARGRDARRRGRGARGRGGVSLRGGGRRRARA